MCGGDVVVVCSVVMCRFKVNPQNSQVPQTKGPAELYGPQTRPCPDRPPRRKKNERMAAHKACLKEHRFTRVSTREVKWVLRS